MLGLTLIQPWGTAILTLGKDVENRTWAPSESTLPIGARFAIHAGAKLDKDAAGSLQVEFGADYDALVKGTRSAILGTVELAAVLTITKNENLLWRGPKELAMKALDSAWRNPEATGLWVLRNPLVLAEPIPCKGALGLWKVPAEHLPALEALSRAA